MRNICSIFILVQCSVQLLLAQPLTPFQKGVNLSNWFQSSTVQEVNFSKYTYDDFVDIQSLGVDVIRVPINLHGMSSGEPDYILDPLLLFFLDQIIDWTEALGMHLILDNHSFDDGEPTTPAIYTPLSKVWPQLAEHFLGRDSTLYFEIKNEPFEITDMIWDTIQQNIVNLIRETDPHRILIVGPANWNSYHNLHAMLNYTDENLIYTFHFYDPFVFTHQGASWTSPSMEPLTGVPFPYGASPMPTCPPSLVGTWIQSNLANYAGQGTAEHMRNLLDIAVAFRTARGVPIYCGEFGTYMRNADPDQRVTWYEETTGYLDSLAIGWTMWDYHGGFGLFEPNSNGMFHHDLNIPLVEAMGFNPPPQSDYVKRPDSVGFYLYDDFIAQGISPDLSSNGEIDLYASTNPRSGNFNMDWSEADQYDRIGFDFKPDKDLTLLHDQNFVLTLWIAGSGTPVDLDIRFVDTKTDLPEDHPWRMSTTLTSGDLIWDGDWQYIQIPLDSFAESGSWDGTWYNPAGLFDWSDIDALQIVSENGDFGATVFSFDEIRIVDATTAHGSPPRTLPSSFSMTSSFPNPFNPSTTIRYSLPDQGFVELSIYDLTGRLVESLISEIRPSGSHVVTWQPDPSLVTTGVYLARLKAGNESATIKMLLLK